MTIGEVAERLRQSTVQIRRERGRHAGAGSGFVWRSDGMILTNAHVVESDAPVSVELWDGRVISAEVRSRDHGQDLACVKIAAVNLPALEFRASPANVGEQAIAIGNPLGFIGAMTKGVVRGTGPVPRLGRRQWVQAAIQLAPGNSGGPLADSAGRVIGINTMVMSGGVALAIPAGVAQRFAVNGPGPRLGITAREVVLGREGRGLLILEIELNSPAENGSLLIGDVVTHLNGSKVTNHRDFMDGLAESGGVIKLHFLRGDRSRVREVTIPVRGVVASGHAA
jgi:serine protease Do